MIGYVQGRALEVNLDSALLLAGGVGYELSCSAHTLSQIEAGGEAALWVYTHVREDALQLFGFIDKIEKQMFLSLLKVNGIGPKMALNILSGASHDQLLAMIESEDVRALSKLPKVGKKTAEQMILTLKGKLVIHAQASLPKPLPPHRELASALLNLGFRSVDIDRVIVQLPKDVDIESGLRTALAALTSL